MAEGGCDGALRLLAGGVGLRPEYAHYLGVTCHRCQAGNMQLRCRANANKTSRQADVPDTPTMRRIKRALAANRRTEATLAAAITDGIAAGDKQIEIAQVIGRSREYVRLLVDEERKRRAG